MDQIFQFESPESPENSQKCLYEPIIHQGKKSFQCQAFQCEKIFRFKSDMERHVIVHTNEKPHTCPHGKCNKKFKRADALKNHIQAHSEGSLLACTVPNCGAQFRKKCLLQFHLLKHEMQPNPALNTPGNNKEIHQAPSIEKLEKTEKKKCLLALSPDDSESFSLESDFENLEDVEDEEENETKEEIETCELSQKEPKKRCKIMKFFSCGMKNNQSENEERPLCARASEFLESLCNRLNSENQALKEKISRYQNCLSTKVSNFAKSFCEK